MEGWFGSGVGYADDVGDGDGEADGEGEAAEFDAPEVGGAYGDYYVAVEVAARGGESPEGVGEGLETRYSLVPGYHVLVEEELASGAEDSAYLAHDEIEVLDHSEGEGCYHAVEGSVGEGEELAYGGYYYGVGVALLGGSGEASGHVGVGFDRYETHAGGIEGDVGAGAAADFEGSAEAEAGGESAVWDDAGFDAGVEKVVPGGEEAFAEFVVFHGELVVSGWRWGWKRRWRWGGQERQIVEVSHVVAR